MHKFMQGSQYPNPRLKLVIYFIGTRVIQLHYVLLYPVVMGMFNLLCSTHLVSYQHYCFIIKNLMPMFCEDGMRGVLTVLFLTGRSLS
jgi:hypothetical protein